jgi:hypothetical protein
MPGRQAGNRGGNMLTHGRGRILPKPPSQGAHSRIGHRRESPQRGNRARNLAADVGIGIVSQLPDQSGQCSPRAPVQVPQRDRPGAANGTILVVQGLEQGPESSLRPDRAQGMGRT